MCNYRLSKRTLLIGVLFFLSSCQAITGPRWEGSRIHGDCFASERWIFDDCRLLSLEYTIYPDPIHGKFFVNIPGFVESNPEVSFTFEDEIFTCIGEVFTGGQRIELPDDVTPRLLARLEAGETFVMSVRNYRLEITSTNFQTVNTRLFNSILFPEN